MSQENNYSILLVDDESDALLAMRTVLETSGFSRILTCTNGAEVLPLVCRHQPDLVVLDVVMPDISGETNLRNLRDRFPDLPVIMATGLDETETAVRCMKLGAHDYILKPLEKERLVAAVQHALEIRSLRRENMQLAEKFVANRLIQPEAFADIVTVDKRMLSIFSYIEMVAPTHYPVLITGETGTGKELVAKAIHRLSGRTGEYIAVNIAGLDDTVFADTLFGHAKGAYTGATESREGLVTKAKNGTLFLDEIGSLSISAQVKLLRLLQEREFLPLGSDIVKTSAVRIVAATCRNLETLQNSEAFRKDLFYRLRLHHVHLPPLREHKDDLVPLVTTFLQQAANDMQKELPSIPPEIFNLLRAYHYPGNTRELQNMVFDAVSLHQGKVLSTRVFKERICPHTPEEENRTPANQTVLLTFHDRLPTLKEAIDLLVEEALKRSDGHQSAAAALLGISRQAISQRLQKMRGRKESTFVNPARTLDV